MIGIAEGVPQSQKDFLRGLIRLQGDVFVLEGPPQTLHKAGASARPRPSRLLVTLADCRRPLNSRLVNWLPWSVLKMAGLPQPSARARPSKQKPGSSGVAICQQSPYRLSQARTANRQTTPWGRGSEVMAQLST